MLKIKRNYLSYALSLSVLAYLVQASVCSSQVAMAAPAAVLNEQTMTKEVGFLENRFFAHQYANDPLEKRLERLELMIFGGTQAGTNDERFQRLKKVIAERPQSSAARKAASAPAPTGDTAVVPKDKESGPSTQYPVLNTLEWRALKKTFPSESLDQRLGRLEQKLFGEDSPTMAYIDRVDRLKRTLGVGITAMQPTGPTGPRPKARPRSDGGDDDSFGFDGAPAFGELPGAMGMVPGFGFGGQASPFGSSLSRTFTQMFADMNREMQEFSKLGPGNWVFDSETGDWVEQGSGTKVHPGPQSGQNKLKPPAAGQSVKPMKPFAMPRPQAMPPVFQFPQRREEPALPPYTDPNSI